MSACTRGLTDPSRRRARTSEIAAATEQPPMPTPQTAAVRASAPLALTTALVGDYTVDGCSIPPPCTNANASSSHGTTDDLDATGGCDPCVCEEATGPGNGVVGNYSGVDCSVPPPCTDAGFCSGHGTTSDLDATNGCDDCKCYSATNLFGVIVGSLSGAACAIPPPCTDATDCSGHGTALDNDAIDGCDTCECELPTGCSGADCSAPPSCDAEVLCNNRGQTFDFDSSDGCDVCVCEGGTYAGQPVGN